MLSLPLVDKFVKVEVSSLQSDSDCLSANFHLINTWSPVSGHIHISESLSIFMRLPGLSENFIGKLLPLRSDHDAVPDLSASLDCLH